MESDSIIQLFFLILMLFLSAFFSSAETAFISTSKVKVQAMIESEENKKTIKRLQLVEKILDKKDVMLSAILIGNNVVNLSASSLTTIVVSEIFGNSWVGLATGTLTLLILIFGEITPKTIATFQSENIAIKYANIIWILMVVLKPLIFVVNKISDIVLAIFGVNRKDNNELITEKELNVIVDSSLESGLLEDEEHEIIKNVFDFDKTLVKNAMTPKVNVSMISEAMSYEEVLSFCTTERYTRYPVYRDNNDNIIGILNVKDLLKYNNETFSMQAALSEPNFVYEFANLSATFKQMRQEFVAISIVLDEYGEFLGIITMEDIVEEIVGELYDEFDEGEEQIKEINDKVVVSGSVSIADINSKLDTDFASETCESLGGLIIENLQKFPEETDSVVIDDYKLTVTQMDNNRIEEIEIENIAQN